MAAFAAEFGISYPLLSDVGSATIREYGILNSVAEWALGPNSDDPAVQADVATYVSVVNPNERMLGIAFPGTFMLDPEGRVTSRYFEEFYRDRNTVSSIVMRIGDGLLPVGGVKLSTGQLELTTYPSDAEIVVGNRFALILEVTPHEDMHVYAPGASEYRVIRLELQDQPYVTVLPMAYPDSKSYYFEPFDEYVPVFEEPFDLIQELVLESSQEAQAALRDSSDITLNGTLEYQACSSTICYPPQRVSLSWTVPLRPLLRGQSRPPIR